MFGLATRQKPPQPAAPTGARPPEARRRILAAIADAEATMPEQLAQFAARVSQARDHEARARRELEAASLELAQLEGAQLAASLTAERQIAGLRHELAVGAPAEIVTMQRDVAALVDVARQKAQTRLADGYEGLDGRRATLVSTNTDTITAFLLAARQVTEDLEALKFSEAPELERLGPFAGLSLAGAQLEAAARHDESGAFVARAVVVPAALADRYAEIAGVANPKPMLSPGAVREAEWDAEREAERRQRWEPWR